MKRFLFAILWLIFFFNVVAAPKTWNGASGGLWSLGSNWLPVGVPAPGDDVTINAFTGTIIVDVASPIALNSITVTINSTVTFDCSATKNFRLSSTSAATPGLLVNVGSTLTLNASNAGTNNSSLDLTYGNGVIGSIYGTLIFSCTGGANNGPKLITTRSPVVANMYAVVTVYNGGIIRIMPDADNTDASLSPIPTLIMLNGSIYENLKNGGSFPVGTWQPNSLARALSPGTATPSFTDGITYGNLEWNCPAQNANGINANVVFNNVNFISTNDAAFRIKSGAAVSSYVMTINGNLDINDNSFIEIVGNTAVSPNTGKIVLKGYLNIHAGGVLSSNGVAGTSAQFEFQGSSNQNITNDGILGGIRLEVIMNGVTATLLTPVVLPGNNNAVAPNLQLQNGKIITTSTNILTMNDNALVSGGSTTSFVAGPMKKIGDDAFTFPIGEGIEYAPIGISAGGASGDAFIAEYFRGNPRVIIGSPYETPAINHMSVLEWWTLDRSAGTSSKNVTLYARGYSDATLLSDLRVIRWDGAIWRNEGNTAFTGVAVGPVTSGVVTGFFTAGTPTAFTFGSATVSENPLPITLISFDASKLSNTKSSVNWESAACCSSAAKFEIQRAGTDKRFVTVGTVGGSTVNRFYDFIDNDLKNGINYYRLKMIDEDGKITWTKTVAVMNGVNGLVLTSLIPTVVANSTALTISSSKDQKVDIIITDIQGRMIRKNSYAVASGNTTIEISLGTLVTGIYHLTGINAEGKTNTIRFLKQ